VSKLRDIIFELGETVYEKNPGLSSLTKRLRQLFKNRACLLVLDDVWQSDVWQSDPHLFPSIEEAPDCCCLLTTRNAEIAQKLGATIISLPLMQEEEAILLLERWMDDQSHHVTVEQKQQIVRLVNSLPLAIQLAGARLQSISADKWISNYNIRILH